MIQTNYQTNQGYYTPPRETAEYPRAAFGEEIVAALEPEVLLSAVNGLLSTTDVQVFTGGTGTVTVEQGQWRCKTGLGIGGFGVNRSRRVIRHKPGMGIRARFTAAFDSANAAANSLQWAGMFSAVDFIGVGYNGTSFGVTHRIPGKLTLVKLTLTAPAVGSINATVTLSGVPFVVALTAGTTDFNASQLGAATYTGWLVEAVGSDVYFLAEQPAVTAGAFTYSSTGASAGTFTTLESGYPNDNNTNHVPLDQIDYPQNVPADFDPNDLHMWEVVIGFGSNFTVRIYDSNTGTFRDLHTFTFEGVEFVLEDPQLRVGVIAASLGSTSAITVSSSFMAAFVEGKREFARTPFSIVFTQSGIDATERQIFSIRNPLQFNGLPNRQVVNPQLVTGAAAGTKPVEYRLYLGKTLTNPLWTWADGATVTSAHKETTLSTPTGGRVVAGGGGPGGGVGSFPVSQVRLQPGEVLTLTARINGGGATDVVGSVSFEVE